MISRFVLLACAALGAAFAADIRVGIIGTDTSHVPAFTAMLNDSKNANFIPGARVVAAYKGGSKDLKDSFTRVDKFAAEIETKYGVEIVPDIKTLLSKVDAVLLESVDGRVHLEQAKPVLEAGKLLFIDKPLSSTLEGAREIARIAKAKNAKWFSSSSLRYAPFVEEMKQQPGLAGALVWGPGPEEATHALDLSWYGVHAVEILYALMGPGCAEVSRTSTAGSEIVTGKWKDGRTGVVKTLKPYGEFGAVAFYEKAVKQSPEKGRYSYVPLVQQIVKFFQTGNVPVPNDETLEMFAFMDAAQRSKQAGGKPVALR